MHLLCSIALILSLSLSGETATSTSTQRSVILSGAEFGIVDTDQTTAPKLSAIEHPSKMSQALEADHHHKVIFKFTLMDKSSKEKILAHQAFVRLFNAKTGAEIIYVAEPDSNSVYKFDLDVNTRSKDFKSNSGLYQVHLIVGDADISNPINWHLADIDLKFSGDQPSAPSSSKLGPQPEIRHKFREPEKRPAAVVSNMFTLLCLSPLLILFIGWMKLGINVSGFPFSLSTLGFHLGLGSIFVLYYYFWLQLDMFTTVKYLMMIGVVTFLCGNSLLVRIAKQKKQ